MLRPAQPADIGARQIPVAQGERRRDAELMRRLVADDDLAFGAIYDRHARSVYGLAHRMLQERAAAEDVAQEAFVALWRNRHRFRPERGSTRSWLLTITRNHAIDAIRRGRGHLHAELDAGREHEAPDRTDEEALRHLDAMAVGAALRTLPAAQRQALELSYFDGLSQSEIATRLGLPLGTVKGRMRLALRKLATQLADQAAALHQSPAEPVRGI